MAILWKLVSRFDSFAFFLFCLLWRTGKISFFQRIDLIIKLKFYVIRSSKCLYLNIIIMSVVTDSRIRLLFHKTNNSFQLNTMQMDRKGKYFFLIFFCSAWEKKNKFNKIYWSTMNTKEFNYIYKWQQVRNLEEEQEGVIPP